MRFAILALGILAATPALAGKAPLTGEQIYTTYCAACHGMDGTGPIGANFVAEPERLAKDDAVLDATIRDGLTTAKGAMPPFGAIVDQEQRTLVIAYLRDRFAPKTDKPEEKPTETPASAE